MSTRFYYYSHLTGLVSNRPSSMWGQFTGQYDVREMGTGRFNTSGEKKFFTEATNMQNIVLINRIYVSPPISAQIEFSGYVRGQIACWSNTGAGFMPRFRVKLCNSSGIDKAAIYTTIFPTGSDEGFPHQYYDYANPISGTNKFFPESGNLKPNVTGVSGDYLVAEIGTICFNITTDPFTGTHFFGDYGPDLPENNTGIFVSGAPWLEFSQDIPLLKILPPTETYVPPTGG